MANGLKKIAKKVLRKLKGSSGPGNLIPRDAPTSPITNRVLPELKPAPAHPGFTASLPISAPIKELLKKIEKLPEHWHGVGSVSMNGLEMIAKLVEHFKHTQGTMETGSGKTTLLLSHLVKSHQVFAIDEGESISLVRTNEMFQKANVTYIEGPTQLTLPKHTFDKPILFALIDGPHGYPFPDMEYYYIYPHLIENSLLLIDDIRIPSIRNMFDVINADPGFELLDIADDNLAAFRRTDKPLIDKLSDGWYKQGFNRPYFDLYLQYAKANGIEPPADA
jgi:hypothetical protein